MPFLVALFVLCVLSVWLFALYGCVFVGLFARSVAHLFCLVGCGVACLVDLLFA